MRFENAASPANLPRRVNQQSTSKDAVQDLFGPRVTNRRVTVFTQSASVELDEGGRGHGRDEDGASRIRKVTSKLLASGLTRVVKAPPADWSEKIDALAHQFPNMRDLISSVVRPHVALVARGMDHRLAPILLVGAPGIGKTHFANELATVLGVGSPLVVSMASESNNSTLGGSSTFWSNSAPGRLFEILAWGQSLAMPIANPLVVLDEVDKVRSRNMQFDPLGTLYTLLEVETARNFTDQSLPDLRIDASHCRIVATANDVSEIAEPLLSRMLVCPVRQPSVNELSEMVRSMYLRLVQKFELEMMSDLSQDVIDVALRMSPREAKMRLDCALASAVVDGRNSIQLADWPAMAANQQRVQRRPIGFTALVDPPGNHRSAMKVSPT